MTPSPPTPKLPLWVFFVADAVLTLTACFIAFASSRPLSSTAIYAIVTCVIGGAIILTIPLVLYYEREKNEVLDDRQRALEALAETVSTSAEQISIAAQGLHTIAALTQQNLQQAGQIPATFQAKVTEFEALLTNAHADEREEMKQELARLRASETDRLETIATKVDHAAAELAKLEATAQKHLAAAQAALASAPQILTAATDKALAEIEGRLSARVAAVAPTPSPKPAAPAKVTAASKEPGLQILPIVPPTAAPFAGHIVSIASGPTSSTADPEFLTAAPFAGNLISAKPLPPLAPVVPGPPPITEPPAPDATPVDASAPETVTSAASGGSSAQASGPKDAGKKRAPRKPKSAEIAEALPAFGLVKVPVTAPATPGTPTGEFSQSAPEETGKPAAEVTETVISSDRATRLLVTAYIGIGNRLFIRGDGPGLSWDKGVPLQFVSIGKWRWETGEATATVKFKLYKNDEIECTALGRQNLDPEHQQEITATF